MRSHSFWTIAAISMAVFFLSAFPAHAHQLVLSTGYANSGTPHVGHGIDPAFPPFVAGGGYAVGVRMDLDAPKRHVWISPSFLFWNNLTGAPDNNTRVNYFQMELGGRVLWHTQTDPKFYGGVGLGYSLAHGTSTPRYANAQRTALNFDGDFPTASLHFGAKTLTSSGVTLLAEASYHFGLENSRGFNSIGPARAILIQIGVGLDMVTPQQ